MGSKAYLVTAFVLAFMVMAVVPLWFVLGEGTIEDAHQHGGVTIPEEWFVGKLQAQPETYGLPDGSVRLPPGSTASILAHQFAFVPGTVRLVCGRLYDLTFFSPDLYNGASLIQSGSTNIVVAPGMTARVSIKATQIGEIRLLCNEYCGAGHHLMKGKIIVE